jgi:hypothetical protein
LEIQVLFRLTTRKIRGDKMALAQVFSEFFGFPLTITISPFLLTDLSSPHELRYNPDQVTRYYTLGRKYGVSSLGKHLK